MKREEATFKIVGNMKAENVTMREKDEGSRLYHLAICIRLSVSLAVCVNLKNSASISTGVI